MNGVRTTVYCLTSITQLAEFSCGRRQRGNNECKKREGRSRWKSAVAPTYGRRCLPVIGDPPSTATSNSFRLSFEVGTCFYLPAWLVACNEKSLCDPSVSPPVSTSTYIYIYLYIHIHSFCCWVFRIFAPARTYVCIG